MIPVYNEDFNASELPSERADKYSDEAMDVLLKFRNQTRRATNLLFCKQSLSLLMYLSILPKHH